jgi:tetratricopeptide (TPR) repeat protein
MSKKKHAEEEEVILDIGGSYNQAEQFVENNKEKLTYGILAVIVVIGAIFSYNQFYLKPLEQEAADQSWKAQQYFNQDSLDLALNGDGMYMGFEELADEYSSTKIGDLSNYYLGMIYLKKGQYEDAIDYLKSYSGDNMTISPIALGAIGDAYMELDEPDEAITYYLKAARKNSNNFTTPQYLLKAGKVAEALGDYSVAVTHYKEIKNDYATTQEGRMIDKYIARAEMLASK